MIYSIAAVAVVQVVLVTKIKAKLYAHTISMCKTLLQRLRLILCIIITLYPHNNSIYRSRAIKQLAQGLKELFGNRNQGSSRNSLLLDNSIKPSRCTGGF